MKTPSSLIPATLTNITFFSKLTRIFKGVSWLLGGNPAQKRRVHLELARISSSFFGDYPLGEDCKIWLEDKKFRNKFQELSPLSPYSMERKWTLREFVRYVKDIPGSMAECGCYDGCSSYFIASEAPNTPLHLFDSFEGLSIPQDDDIPIKINSRAWQKGDLAIPEDVARERLREFSNIFIHKGWIPDEFPKVKDDTFCFVHIDVDLYQPTKDSLSFFYPRLSKGGVIILDDNGFTTCPGALKATIDYLSEENIDTYPLILTTGQSIIFKR